MSTVDGRLREVFAEAFETEPDRIDEDLSVDTSPEWDSMRSIVLTAGLEAEFGVEFTDAELVSLNSFRKIRSALTTKGVS